MEFEYFLILLEKHLLLEKHFDYFGELNRQN